MNWFALSCVTALTQAVKDTFLKRSMAALDATTAMIGYCLSASVFLWLAVAAGPPVSLVSSFWTWLAVGGLPCRNAPRTAISGRNWARP